MGKPTWLQQGRILLDQPKWHSMMVSLHQWTRDEPLTSSTWICMKPLTLSHTTSLSLNWKEMDLKGRLSSGLGIGWKVAAKGL